MFRILSLTLYNNSRGMEFREITGWQRHQWFWWVMHLKFLYVQSFSYIFLHLSVHLYFLNDILYHKLLNINTCLLSFVNHFNILLIQKWGGYGNLQVCRQLRQKFEYPGDHYVQLASEDMVIL